MATLLLEIRPPRAVEAAELAEVQSAAWRNSYWGILPPVAIERYLSNNGVTEWVRRIRGRSITRVISFDKKIVGFGIAGPARTRRLGYNGEIYELYVKPECQGCGFGTELFRHLNKALYAHGRDRVMVWALTENNSARQFYTRLGGMVLTTAPDTFGGAEVEKIAYGFPATRSIS